MIGIYKTTSPTKKVYIGQSIDINYRFKKYKRLDCKKQQRLYNSLKKHGVDNHKFEVIIECTLDKLNELERYYQDLYSVTEENGLNIKLTQTSEKKVITSLETRKKISDSKIGNKNPMYGLIGYWKGKNRKGTWKRGPHSEETKQKISLTQKGKKISENHKRNISIGSKGKIYSEETIKKMSLASIGKPKSDTAKLNMKKSWTPERKKQMIETKRKNKLLCAKKSDITK